MSDSRAIVDRPEKTLQILLRETPRRSHERHGTMTESRAKPRAKGMSCASKPRTARALGDSTTASKIRFSATLFRPVATAKAVTWTFLTLPKEASVKLPSRGMTSVEGTFNDVAFRATLQPDGQGGHWLKVDRKLRERQARRRAMSSRWKLRRWLRNRNPRCRPICGRLSLPPTRKRGRYGRISRPSRAGIGSSGSSPPSGKRRDRSGSRVPAICSPKGSDAPAASIGLECMPRALSCPVADDTSSDTRR